MTTHRITSALLATVGIAHLLPATAARSRRRVERTYGVRVADPGTELLLRHRATFFGLVGAALLAGAADPRCRWPAIATGAASVASFLALAGPTDALSPQLRRVRDVDVVLLGMLGAAAACEAVGGHHGAGNRKAASEEAAFLLPQLDSNQFLGTIESMGRPARISF